MSRNRIKRIDFTSYLHFWMCSLYAGLAYSLRALLTFWTTTSPAHFPDKPLSSLVNSAHGSHSYIKVQRIKFHYVEAGEKRKPLVLLLHGFLDCWIGWKYQIPVLKEYFRVVAVDLKGYGDSEKPQWRKDYQITVLVRELHGLVKSLGAKRCVVIGHDIGAMVGWYLTALHPEMVAKFVSISCPHPNVYWQQLSSSDDHVINSRFVYLSQLPGLAEKKLLQNNLSIIDNLFGHLQKMGETELLKAYKYVFSRREDIVGPINYLRMLPLVRLDPGSIKTPTLLIIGSKSSQGSAESIVRSTSFLKDFKLKMVDGAGHFPHQQHSPIVNEILIDFLVGPAPDVVADRPDGGRSGLIGSLVSNTFKYGNSIVDNVVKTTNSVVWKPHQAKA